MNDTNVGLGMVPHRPTCRCDECRAERTAIELRTLRARLAEAERLLRIAYVTMGGRPINVDAAIKWQADVEAWRLAVHESARASETGCAVHTGDGNG